MKRIVASFFFVLVVFQLRAQKIVDDPNAAIRTVGSFHGIHVGTGIQLVITEGSTETVAVSANKPEYRDKIVTEVDNGILKIYYDNKLNAISTHKDPKKLRAYVSYKTLDELDANTGATVQVEGTLKTPSLKLKANTGGTVNGVIKADFLDVRQNTGAVVSLSGEAGTFSFDGDLGAVFNGADLKTDTCTVAASTGSGVYITVQKGLSVKASTGGFVKYKGDAASINVKTSTGGSVSKM